MRDFMPCAGCDEPEACEIEGRCLEPAPLPLFAVSVAQRKWESLQAEGYRMQRIEFAVSKDGKEKRGSIDPWGKVLWHSDSPDGGQHG